MVRLIDLLKEAKQVGILYHFTTFEAGLKILHGGKATEEQIQLVEQIREYLRDQNINEIFN